MRLWREAHARPFLYAAGFLLAAGCSKKLATEDAEKLLRARDGAQHDIMCSYQFDKVATVPTFFVNSEKGKCFDKLKAAGLATFGQWLEADDKRSHPWEFVVAATPSAKMAGTRLTFPCGVAKFGAVVSVTAGKDGAHIKYSELVEPKTVPADVYARCEIDAPVAGQREREALAVRADDGAWELKE
jgi:hypothetical protein